MATPSKKSNTGLQSRHVFLDTEVYKRYGHNLNDKGDRFGLDPATLGGQRGAFGLQGWPSTDPLLPLTHEGRTGITLAFHGRHLR